MRAKEKAMDMKEAEELMLMFKDKVFDVADGSISHCVAPLVHIKDDKDIKDCRTGVLIQIDYMKFLVTAGHGMVKFFEEDMAPFLVMPDKDLHPIALQYELFWTTKDEQKDLSVTRLTDSTLAYMGNHYRFLRLDDMMSRKHPRQGQGFYLLLGFPNQRYEYDEERKIRANTWKYLTVQYRKDFADVKPYDPAKHLIVEYERATKTGDGQTVHPPGLSGCGIWYIGNPLVNPVFRPEDFKLTGIQTSWNEVRQYAKGTWIDAVMGIIWEYYPEAHAPMRLHGIEF